MRPATAIAHPPETGRPWPPMPDALLDAWSDARRLPPPPEACLINFYGDGGEDGPAPGSRRRRIRRAGRVAVARRFLRCSASAASSGTSPPVRSASNSGDALSLGGHARLAFHGVDRIYRRLLDPLAAGRQDQSDASAGERKRMTAICRSPPEASFGPPLETPTMAGRSTRSTVQPVWTTWETAPAGTVSSGASKIAWWKLGSNFCPLGRAA